MASRHPEAAGLIAESTFTSIYDMGTRDGTFLVFPLRLLLHQRMDSIAKMRSLRVPVLFIHGADDHLVPAAMSRMLFEAAPQPKTLLLVPYAGHENAAAVGGETYRSGVLRFAGSVGARAAVATR
jgi:fermentation-respiration switch protein FrsA (DUF1100 family)